MKKIFVKTLFIAMSALILHSCELDNYDGSDATFGRIIDKETGELVEQDIIRGTQIEFIEHGMTTMLTQYMVIKNEVRMLTK